jgi:hypothetical protein
MASRYATTTNGSDRDPRVGKGSPPRHSQFKRGKSGNPKGRPKGVRNFATDVQRMLRVETEVHEGSDVRAASTQEAALIVLRKKALAGDARSLDRLLEQSARFNNQPSPAKKGPLPEEDQAILDAYVAEVVASGNIAARSKKK